MQIKENDRSLNNDLIKIRELHTSRIIVHRSFDLKHSAGILRDITLQEEYIISEDSHGLVITRTSYESEYDTEYNEDGRTTVEKKFL